MPEGALLKDINAAAMVFGGASGFKPVTNGSWTDVEGGGRQDRLGKLVRYVHDTYRRQLA